MTVRKPDNPVQYVIAKLLNNTTCNIISLSGILIFGLTSTWNNNIDFIFVLVDNFAFSGPSRFGVKGSGGKGPGPLILLIDC